MSAIEPVITGDIDDRYEHLVALDNHQGLTPDAILSDASQPESPLHSMFEWDNNVAADKYRKLQATAVLQRFRVLRSSPNGEVAKLKAWVFVPSEKRHRHVDDVMKNESLSAEVLGQMRRDLLAFQNRFQSFGRLVPQVSDVLDGVETLAKSIAI